MRSTAAGVAAAKNPQKRKEEATQGSFSILALKATKLKTLVCAVNSTHPDLKQSVKMADATPIYSEDEQGHPQFRLGSKTYKLDFRILDMMYTVNVTAFGFRRVLYVKDVEAQYWRYYPERKEDALAVVEAYRAYRRVLNSSTLLCWPGR